MSDTVATEVDLEALIKSDDLAVCKCVLRPMNGHRVLRTQHAGRILETPVSLGDFQWRHDAVDVAEPNRGDGSYAVIVPVYECGHDHHDWIKFWYRSWR